MELNIENINVREAALVFRAIDHKLRRQILALLHVNKRMDVSSIYDKLDIEQSVASSHLAILRKSGFVNTEREGRCIYYSVNYKRIEVVSDFVGKLLVF